MKDKIFIFLTPLILFVCLFIFAFTSNAASDQDYFPMHQNYNGKFTDPLINYIENTLNTNDNYIFCSYSGIGNPNSPNYKTYEFLYISIPKDSNTMIYGEKNNDLIHFSLYKVGSGNPTGGYIKYNPHFGTFDNITYTGILSYFQNLTSSNYDTNKDYVSNFQVMTNNTSSAHVVLFYDDGITVPDGDTAREDMEMPDISDYIPDWSNPPSFDNSSVENAISSLNDTVHWLGSNLKNTIQGGLSYVGDTVRWGLQKVLDRITDTAQSLLSGIQTKINEVITSIGNKLEDIKDFFSNNGIVGQIKGFLSDVKDGVTYLTQPLDSNIVNLAFHNTNFYTLADDYVDFFDDFHDAFDIAEPDTFTLTIYVNNVRTLYNFGVHDPVVIHLDQNFIPIRQALRTFLWILVSFGAVFVVDKGLANWLRGERN